MQETFAPSHGEGSGGQSGSGTHHSPWACLHGLGLPNARGLRCPVSCGLGYGLMLLCGCLSSPGCKQAPLSLWASRPAGRRDGGRPCTGRILQLPDITLHGFQALRDRRGGRERRHSRYGNLGTEKEPWSQRKAPQSFQPPETQTVPQRSQCRGGLPLPSYPEPLSLATLYGGSGQTSAGAVPLPPGTY